MNGEFPLEFVSNIVSLIVIVSIVMMFVKYKKRVAVIDGFAQLSKGKKLTDDDKKYIKDNISDYQNKLVKQEAFIKLMYPALVLVAGVFLFFFPFAEALIHINIIVVTFIYLYVKKIHYRNYITMLEAIKI